MTTRLRQLLCSLGAYLWPSCRSERAFRLAMLATLGFGVWLRFAGLWSPQMGLWLDEASWAIRLVEKPLSEAVTIRPAGLMWLTKQLVAVTGPSEFWLRFPSLVGALGALALMPYLASQLVTSRVSRILLVLLFALHPALIDFAKEFKPYSFEVFVHVGTLALLLRARQTQKLTPLYWLLGFLPFTTLFSFTIAFAYPALYLIALVIVRRTGGNWRGFVAAIASGLASILVIGAVFALAHGSTQKNGKKTVNYWGDKYDVFYTKNSPEKTRAEWLARKTQETAALPGLRRDRWEVPKRHKKLIAEWKAVDRLGWILLHFIGLFALFTKRRTQDLALLGVPLFVMLLFCALGKWPGGAFRTNLFACLYTIAIATVGFDHVVRHSRLAGWVATAAVVIISILPGFALGFDSHQHKRTWTRDHYMQEMLERVVVFREEQLSRDADRPKAYLLSDLHSLGPFKYYTRTHPSHKKHFGPYIEKNFRASNTYRKLHSQAREALLKSDEPVWMLASSSKTAKQLRKLGRVLHEEQVGEKHWIIVLSRR